MVPSSSSSVVKLGPWGSTGGSPWDDGGGYTGIRSITIQHSWGWGVETIKVGYDRFGESVLGEKHGGGAQKWEPETYEIGLDFPDEFLTGVIGYYDDKIQSLTFRTNRNKTFEFGSGWREPGQRKFECSVEGGRGAIIGFSGMSGWWLYSMAIYVAVLCPAGEFFDEMQKQGLVAYRTSPLCMPRTSK